MPMGGVDLRLRDSDAVPNLDFYAADNDWSTVLQIMFSLDVFRVFEAYSVPERELREFHGADEIPDVRQVRDLALFVADSGPNPIARRIDLVPGAPENATFRYTCEGWGLIQLCRGESVGEQELRWSHTNHNTEKRATSWAGTLERLGDPHDWDWAAVTRASGQLNRAVGRMAVSKIGGHPVLPRAAQFIAHAGLRYEHGIGIHARPSFGIRRA
jgi:hypothetical protein